MIDKIQWLIEKLENKKHEKEMLYAELDVNMEWKFDVEKNTVWPMVYVAPRNWRKGVPSGISECRHFRWNEKELTDDEWIDEMYEEAIESYGESLCSQSKED